MTTGLQVAYLWHDVDVLEIRVRVGNENFTGTADVYVGHEELIAAAQVLDGFPSDSTDQREISFGVFGREFAGGAVRLRFYCRDLPGHAEFEATIESDHMSKTGGKTENLAEHALIRVPFEPASLDSFIVELRTLGNELRGRALLSATE